ncbi:cardiolipin synthase [Oecophyllibacter saccharovorans]|uniref:phospholipase D-like domain-containing protein n=1 Tax=Oecophyllibacter saccharovorans TaxID=2558360 RepID=UPI001143D97A|nr:phospholipase D-like domain-containing protein [Oecophyllibacter saccharovorans]QDH14864.1 cardiolipin synthase [Oecophyllibacter saccharovorans]
MTRFRLPSVKCLLERPSKAREYIQPRDGSDRGLLKKVRQVEKDAHAATPLHAALRCLRLAAALGVTVHALLTKRNTAAATGWISFCWSRPLTGTLLYLTFGINRVQRKAQRLMDRCVIPPSPSLDALSCKPAPEFRPLNRMLDLITPYPLLGGNQVNWYKSGDTGYPAMLEAINQAESYVVLCSYIFRYDLVGKQFVKALGDAVARGVEVRVLVDGWGSGYFYCPIQKALEKVGVPCARFMHSFLPWRMTFINLRNHRKLLVVDGKVSFTGGMNILQEALMDLPQKHHVADTAFRLIGPVALQLMDAFARDWAFTTGEILSGPKFYPKPPTPGKVPSRVVASAPDADMGKIEYTILQAVILAQRHVCLMTPYFIPDARLASELALAALRGVRVDLIVPHHSNHHFVDDARNFYLKPLVKAGVHVWFGGAPFDHSKLMTVDGLWSLVGSANLDPRSLRLNFECDAALYDQEMAGTLLDYMEMRRGEELTLADIKRWPLWVKLRNATWRLLSPYL